MSIKPSVDYIVVGLGIAGLSFCEQLDRAGKSFVVIDSGEKGATAVAGGVVNPVVLKRFTPAWNSAAFLESAQSFYLSLAAKLDADIYRQLPIHRIFNNPQEQNDWMVASDLSKLSSFLSSEILTGDNPSVKSPFGLGQVNYGFKIDTGLMLRSYRSYLHRKNCLHQADFSYPQLEIKNDGIAYANLSAKKIVFAQGAAVSENPYFTIDTLIPKKGEYIVFKSASLKLKSVLKGPFFIIPLEGDLYKAGATFVHGDFSYSETEQSRNQIVAAVEKMIDGPVEVVDQMVGMRPTVKDRRPLLGSISEEKVIFFNGLGTRGIMMAPLLSQWLFDALEKGEALPKEVNIRRYS